MSLKSYAKRHMPDAMLEYVKHRRRLQAVETHKAMSREEIVDWLSEAYGKAIGAKLDLGSPQRYTEKIQWCKLNAMDDTKSKLSDKLAVREWVEERIGSRYLIPLLGSWENPGDIDFGTLPKSFVLKTNNASGTNIIVPDKSKLNEKGARMQLGRWLKEDFGWFTFESQYLSIPPRVIAEEFVSNPDGSEASDYKIHCFGGKARYVRVDLARHGDHRRACFDVEWNVQDWCEGEFARSDSVVAKPKNLDELISLAEKLAMGFPHVRVDFYVVGEEPLFGEMTFSSGSGFEKIFPDEWDYKLGAMWDLTKEAVSPFPVDAPAF